jgi:hypothetical protein
VRPAIPTIKVATRHGECLYEADRVVRDSLVYAVEARRERSWVRVATIPSANVTSVQRLLPGAAPAQWLVEDVRTVAGLDHHSRATLIPARARTTSRLRWRPLRRGRRNDTSVSEPPSTHAGTDTSNGHESEMR